jgi:hypothetical protein
MENSTQTPVEQPVEQPPVTTAATLGQSPEKKTNWLLISLLAVLLLALAGYAVYAFSQNKSAKTSATPTPTTSASTSASAAAKATATPTASASASANLTTYDGGYFTLKYNPSVLAIEGCAGQGGASSLTRYLKPICLSSDLSQTNGAILDYDSSADYAQQFITSEVGNATAPTGSESITPTKNVTTINGNPATIVTISYNYSQTKSKTVDYLVTHGGKTVVVSAGSFTLDDSLNSDYFKAVDAMARSVVFK